MPFLTGRAVLLLAALTVPLMLAPTVGVLSALWSIWFLVLCIDAAWAASPKQLQITRRPTPSVRMLRPAQSVLDVRNLSRRRMRGTLRDAWPPSAGARQNRLDFQLAPEASQSITTHLRPKRRGWIQSAKVTVASYGPLGLAGRQNSCEVPGQLQVMPEFSSRRRIPAAIEQLSRAEGKTKQNLQGPSTEFDTLREYVPGDDVRHISWSATARRQQPIVATWRPEKRRNIVVVIDSSRLSAVRIEGGQRLESYLDATLFLTSVAQRAGDVVDVLVVDSQTRHSVLKIGPGQALTGLNKVLAQVESRLVEANWDEIINAVRSRKHRRGMVVLLTPINPAAADGLIWAAESLATRHHLVIGSLGDDAVAALAAPSTSAALTTEDTFVRASATKDLLENANVSGELQRLGAVVVDASAEDFATRLTDAYITARSSGRL